MLLDLKLMGDVEFSKKWGVCHATIIRRRKELNIKSFNNQHGTKEHKFENGLELKWCQQGRHWEQIGSFGRKKGRFDGLDSWCKAHSKKRNRQYYITNNRADKLRAWSKTSSGKLSKRATWRKATAKKKSAYIQWSRADELKVFNLLNGCCAYCNTILDLSTCEFDHFVPIVRGGLTQPSNMLPCCANCNHGKDGKFTNEPRSWLIAKFNDEDDRYNRLSSLLSILRGRNFR